MMRTCAGRIRNEELLKVRAAEAEDGVSEIRSRRIGRSVLCALPNKLGELLSVLPFVLVLTVQLGPSCLWYRGLCPLALGDVHHWDGSQSEVGYSSPPTSHSACSPLRHKKPIIII